MSKAGKITLLISSLVVVLRASEMEDKEVSIAYKKR